MASKDATKPKSASGANKNRQNRTLNIVFTIVAVLLIIIILPLLVVSVTLIIKGSIYDRPPDIFGYAPLTVASGSMSGTNEDSFDEGDLIFIKVLTEDEKQTLSMNDVVCYYVDDIYVTHRIVGITYADDGVTITQLITMGDANNTLDDAIDISSVFGIYAGKVRNLGSFADFLQSTAGIAVFIGVPVVAFIIFDVTRIMLLKKKESDSSALQSKDEEIARLKKMLGEQGGAGNSGGVEGLSGPDGGKDGDNG